MLEDEIIVDIRMSIRFQILADMIVLVRFQMVLLDSKFGKMLKIENSLIHNYIYTTVCSGLH